MQISPHFSRDFLRVFSPFWLLLRSFFFPLYFPFSSDTAFLLFWTSGMRHQDSPGNFLWGLISWWPLQARSIVLSCEHPPLSANIGLCDALLQTEQPSDVLRGHRSLLLSWGNHNNQSVRMEIVSSNLFPIEPLATTLHPSDPAFGPVIPPSSHWCYPSPQWSHHYPSDFTQWSSPSSLPKSDLPEYCQALPHLTSPETFPARLGKAQLFDHSGWGRRYGSIDFVQVFVL